jgi:hypothetical protein
LATTIELLTSLQRLDQAISEKVRAAEDAARQRRTLEEAAQEHAADLERLRAESVAVKSRQRTLEGEIADLEDKMKDRRMRMQRIRSEREIQATKREIDLLKERTVQLEDDGLKVMEEAESLGTRLAALEERLTADQQALAQERAALVAREAALRGEMAHSREARSVLASGMDGGLIRRYDLIFSRRGGTAVVAVRSGTCQGCHMNVPHQLVNQILKGLDVFACPSCQRLLFPEMETDAST